MTFVKYLIYHFIASDLADHPHKNAMVSQGSNKETEPVGAMY